MEEEEDSVLASAEENEFIDISNIKQWDIKTIPENFFMLIASKRRSGKTHLVRHILKPLHKRFDRAYLFSETAHLQADDPYDYIPSAHRYNHFDEDVIRGILSAQANIKEQQKKFKESQRVQHHVLIILDDVITGPEIRRSQGLKSLATQGRHSDVSVICLSQTISAKSGFPSVIRDNVDIFICFTLHSVFNRETSAECYASIVNKKEGIKLINSITQEKPYQVAAFDLSITNVKKYEDYVFKYIAPADKGSKFVIGDENEKREAVKNMNDSSFLFHTSGHREAPSDLFKFDEGFPSWTLKSSVPFKPVKKNKGKS
jgi:hypothetical protein